MVPLIDGQLALGFGLGVAAAVCYDTGYALQALEARRAPSRLALKPSLFGHLLRRRLWVGATVLSLIGWPLQILALSQAPLTLVQPTLALGLLILLVLGSRLLHERVGGREIGAVALVIAAVGLSAWASPDQSGAVPRDAGLVVALSILVAVAISPYVVAAATNRRLFPVLLLIVGAGSADAFAAFAGKLIAEDGAAAHWLPVVLWVVAVGAVILLGFLSETTALQRAAATRVAPTVLTMQIAIPIAMAPLVGGEGWGSTPAGGAVLAAALVMLVAGVALLGGAPAVAGVIAESEDGAGGARQARE
jgi:drug/metabolite transporter (DMT)-like permease